MNLVKLWQDAMDLEELAKHIQPVSVRGPVNFEVAGIAYDSRKVRPGYVFVALPGQRTDGREYVEDAIRRGAVAIVSESECVVPARVAQILVRDARQALAEISCAFYGQPSQHLEVIGVTGTNGKTTTTFLCREILARAGRRPGLVGTVRYEIGERLIPASRTTPEAPDIQAMLSEMVRAGCTSVVMEVSSHGLHQKRVWGIDFDVGVFTNLSQDHLDYHGTMEAYFDAKAQLFRGLGQMRKQAWAVINMDNPWGVRLAEMGGWRARLLLFGLHPNAHVRAERVKLDAGGSSFLLITPWGKADVALNLPGAFNVSNALAAVAACGTLGAPLSAMVEALSACLPVPGRVEPVPTDLPCRVFVDYAHTPDALLQVLTTLRPLTPKHLIVVFGCGGNRDRGKRPLMGRVAIENSDYVIVTSDNPRNEDPAAIIHEIEEGIRPAKAYEKWVDRREAIKRALSMAGEGDIVLIAGKGHETYQEFADRIVPFDDREVVREVAREIIAEKPRG